MIAFDIINFDFQSRNNSIYVMAVVIQFSLNRTIFMSMLATNCLGSCYNFQLNPIQFIGVSDVVAEKCLNRTPISKIIYIAMQMYTVHCTGYCFTFKISRKL